MDVARRTDGEWTIIELGDGQVAGLPESADGLAFYAALKARRPAESLP
ncbi:MAG: ATP-grasp domain-containing protein [Chloroflexota bacterium]